MGLVADQAADLGPGIRPAAAAAAAAAGNSGPSRVAVAVAVAVAVGRSWVGMGIDLVHRSLGSVGRSTRCDPVGWRYRRRRIGHLADRAEDLVS